MHCVPGLPLLEMHGSAFLNVALPVPCMAVWYRNARSGVFLDPMYGIQVQVSRYLMAPWCNFCHGRAHGLEALEAHLKTLRQASAYISAEASSATLHNL